MESFRIVRIVSGWFRKFLVSLDIFQIVQWGGKEWACWWAWCRRGSPSRRPSRVGLPLPGLSRSVLTHIRILVAVPFERPVHNVVVHYLTAKVADPVPPPCNIFFFLTSLLIPVWFRWSMPIVRSNRRKLRMKIAVVLILWLLMSYWREKLSDEFLSSAIWLCFEGGNSSKPWDRDEPDTTKQCNGKVHRLSWRVDKVHILKAKWYAE